MANKKMARIRLAVKWFEEYKCGCVSEYTLRKKDLLGYCETHGQDRIHVWKDYKDYGVVAQPAEQLPLKQ